MNSILFVSNGHGEDAIGAALASEMRRALGCYPAGFPPPCGRAVTAPGVALGTAFRTAPGTALRILALPLVGDGEPYLRAGIPAVHRNMPLPSGGFSVHGLRRLVGDVKAGLISIVREQARALAREVPAARLTIVVGDVYGLFLTWAFGARHTSCPIVFVPTAKSAYISRHFAAEKWFMRKVCRLVLPRDAPTFEELLAYGIRAGFCGNLMMDAIPPETGELELAGFDRVIGLLPGSRREARHNLLDMLDVVVAIHKETHGTWKGGGHDGYGFVAALAHGFDIEAFCREAASKGWQMAGYRNSRWPVIRFGGDGPAAGGPAVILTTGIFGDVVARADIFIGLAGTANEQACGMGRPVVTFPGRGPQFSRSFAVRQRRLLGDAVFLCERSPGKVAGAVLSILNDPGRYRMMAEAGRSRMWGPGATGRACELIMKILS
ncbi:MAG TPA: hypothetical protein GX506_11190 [Firmicutes bacterium]|nr:hypothetical protein [Bacillota bacterium]